MSGDMYFVRHGAYNLSTQSLDAKGIEDSYQASRVLLGHGLGSTALVLSSSIRRAVETSEIIAEGLGASVVQSMRIAVAGENPYGVESIEDCIRKSLEEARVVHEEGPLVVVTHAPLLRTVLHGSSEGTPHIGNGEVFEYIPGTWENRDLQDHMTRYIERMINDDLA